MSREIANIRQISNLRFDTRSRLATQTKIEYNTERKNRPITDAPIHGLSYAALQTIYKSMHQTMSLELREKRDNQYAFIAAKYYSDQVITAMLDRFPVQTKEFLAATASSCSDSEG